MEINFYEIINTFLYTILCKMFVEIFAEKREKIPKGFQILLLILLTGCYSLVALWLESNFLVKQIVTILCGAVVMWIYFYIKIFKSVLLLFFYQGLCFVIDYIAWMGLQKLLMITNKNSFMLMMVMGQCH